MNALLEAAINKDKITDAAIEDELYCICEDQHASCNDECPIYEDNGHHPLGYKKPFSENRGCDCFKNGKAMLAYLRSK
jgi:hypothetical protein